MGSGCPVIVERAARPWSVIWYLAGFPKKSTLYSTKPNDVNCLITHRVVHSEPSLRASASSESAIPSLLFAMADMAAIRWGDAATLRSNPLCPLASAGQTQSPLGMKEAERVRFINPAWDDLIGLTRLSIVFSFVREVNPSPPCNMETMEVVTECADQRTELEEKIRSLEAAKASLLSDVASLKEKIATFELEKSANALESEVQALRTEKAVLEEKAASYEAEAGYALPPVVAEGV